MHRVLIADPSAEFADILKNQIRHNYTVECCDDGVTALELLRTFNPDVLVLDVMLCGLDGWTILQTLQDTGCTPKIIITTRLREEYILNRLSQLGVSNVFIKPCRVEAVAACIHGLCCNVCDSAESDWRVENELENILIRLMFQIGTARYNCVYHAVLCRYDNPDYPITKYVYPEVAKICGGNRTRVEKAIRDAIGSAFESGSKALWMCFFPPGADGVAYCPSNDVFIGRIAACLRQKKRVKEPYIRPTQKRA